MNADPYLNILVVVDMQNDFITGTLANPAAEKIVDGIVEEMKKRTYDRVYFTMDMHPSENRYLASHEGQRIQRLHCEFGKWGWELEPRIKAVVRTNGLHYAGFTKSAFGAWNLASALHEMEGKVSSVTLVGTCTDYCVIATAMLIRAALPEIDVFVKSDLCAGSTEENHQKALDMMRHCHIDVI